MADLLDLRGSISGCPETSPFWTGTHVSEKQRTVALYLRVSADDQTVDMQRRELLAAVERHGWTVTAEYSDEGISGAKARDQRPAFDKLSKDATRQWLDTSTPAGKAMFQMLGVFAEFERSMIVQRVRAGIAKARAQGTRSGKTIGRPKVADDKISAIRAALAAGNGIRKAAKLVGVGNETVHRIAR